MTPWVAPALMRRIAYHGIVPVADKTLRRPLVGRFFRLVAPDVVPIMCEAEGIPGFHIATGFSGHGFGIGPGAGKAAAGMLTGLSKYAGQVVRQRASSPKLQVLNTALMTAGSGYTLEQARVLSAESDRVDLLLHFDQGLAGLALDHVRRHRLG